MDIITVPTDSPQHKSFLFQKVHQELRFRAFKNELLAKALIFLFRAVKRELLAKTKEWIAAYYEDHLDEAHNADPITFQSFQHYHLTDEEPDYWCYVRLDSFYRKCDMCQIV